MANFTLVGNETRLFEYFQYSNDVTGGQFGNWTLIVIYFIILIGSKNFSDPRAHGVASFITTIAAILLNRAGVVSYLTMTISMIISTAVFAWLFFGGRDTEA